MHGQQALEIDYFASMQYLAIHRFLGLLEAVLAHGLAGRRFHCGGCNLLFFGRAILFVGNALFATAL